MSTRTTHVRLSALCFATAVLTLAADIFLILAYVFEVSTNGPYVYGRTHDSLGAIAALLTAIVVYRLSQQVRTSRGSRILVVTAVAASLASALCLLLALFGALDFWTSSVIAIAVLATRAVWMLWLNTRLYAQGMFPRLLSRIGQLVGGGILVGILLGAASLLLPWLTISQLAVLGVGVFIGGGVWLASPVWWLLVGGQLRKTAGDGLVGGPRAAPNPA